MLASEKIAAALAMLKTRGVAESTAAPPLWRLSWRLGLHLPPPHFLGFVAVTFLTGVPFGSVFTLAIVPFFLLLGKPPGWPMLVPGGIGGGPFGCALAAHYHWSARRLGLPPWSTYDTNFDSHEETW